MVYKTSALPIELRSIPPGWNRTNNPPVMSRVLYQLSYRIGQGGIEPTVLSTMVFKTIAFGLSATCFALDRNRTHNLLCVRQPLYQLSYQIFLDSVRIELTTPTCKTGILPIKTKSPYCLGEDSNLLHTDYEPAGYLILLQDYSELESNQ
jgi:hypothetical protein